MGTAPEETDRKSEETDRKAGGRWRAWRNWLPFLAKPLRRGVLLFVLLLIIEYLVVPELVGASKDLYLLGQVNAAWLAAGVILEGVALFCYALLSKVLLPPDTPGLWVLFRIDLAAAAVAHVIPAGTVGSAGVGYRLFTTNGISGKDAAVMMATKGLGSTVVLNVLVWLSLVISIPLAGFQPIYGTVAVIGAVAMTAIGILVFGITKGSTRAARILCLIGDRIPGVSGERLEETIRDAANRFSILARNRRVMAWALTWAALNWLLDAASLWCFVAAFGHVVNPVELFAAYGVANMAGAIPLTPGGLGVVDSVTPLLLVSFGVTRSVATLGVLGWRLVNFWLPIPTGALSYVSLKVPRGAGLKAMRSAIAAMRKNLAPHPWSEPRHDDEIRAGALAGDPPPGDPPADGPLAGDPAAGDPAAEEPPVGSPAGGRPPVGSPAVGEPAGGEPAGGRPPVGSPAVGEPPPDATA